MTLVLDARQRAMLLEMGVRVWQAPKSGGAPAPADASVRARAPEPLSAEAATCVAAPEIPTAQSTPEPAPSKLPAQRQGHTAPPGMASAALADDPPASTLPGPDPSAWTLHPLQLLFPNAPPESTPQALGAGWLLITEAVDPVDPWADSAKRLLAAMLQALQLQRHPRVGMCVLEAASGGSGVDSAAITADIARQVAAFAPSVVLVMGRHATRAALGQNDPYGKLRTQDLRIAGVPAIATYDAPFLLRNPACKRLAWVDLCRARAMAGAAQTG